MSEPMPGGVRGRWYLAHAYKAKNDDVEALLADGWEPFATTAHVVHFRRWQASESDESQS